MLESEQKMAKKRLNRSIPFLTLFSKAKFFAYSSTAERGEELQGVGEQVRDCLEKPDIFKTLDQIRYTGGYREGSLR